ncbi:MAG: DUF3093 domain-containing protein [Microbacteriaceae bacterium]|nr:DUF3093 domain-containing protein [Microbacteriaceae bacterium]
MQNRSKTSVTYREKLWPTPWLYIILLLLVPAIMLLLMPISVVLGAVIAPLTYVIFALFFTLTSPEIVIENGEFRAGRAHIPTDFLGEITTLDSDELSVAIGIEADARAFLLVRGWIHKGVKVTNTDPTDPAPYWIVTTRRPQELADALKQAQASA